MFEIKKIESLIIDQLLDHWDVRHFNKEFDLFYKGQVPTSAIFIESGKVAIVKRNKTTNFLQPKQIIFLEELLLEKELKYTIRVYPNSQIFMIDRYSIAENFLMHA